MPWLSRSNSPNPHRDAYLQNPEDVIHKAARTKAGVTFVPAMIDGSCGTSPVSYRQTPIHLFWNDVKLMAHNLDCIPEMARTICTLETVRDVFETWKSARDILLQILLAIVQICALSIVIPAYLFLPGAAFLGGCITLACTVAILSSPLKGRRVVRNKGYIDMEYSDERWIYVNGSMTSHNQLEKQLTKLSDIFGRQITGIHNQSNGIIFDLIYSFLSHCLSLTTPVSTNLYTQLREPLLSPTMRKVIVIGHGTGAHLISLALDKLHADLPIDILSKLEIYTFGSGARHLSNPLFILDGPMNINGNGPMTRADGSIISPVKAALATRGYRTEDTERIIPHCEHYAFSTDLTAQCGILHHTCQTLDNRLCGRLFLLHRPGFLFSHYLDTLFPSIQSPKAVLNEVVAVDVQTAEKREFTAQGVSVPLKTTSPRNSLMLSNSPIVSGGKRNSWNDGGVYGTAMDAVGQARNSAREAEGQTVQQLSRLWRYVDGARPVGEGIPASSGTGNANGAPFYNGSHGYAAYQKDVMGLGLSSAHHHVMM
ncbi:hypothetical protein PVAG01_05437 [Phlyctema vagabunda]|uniref:Fungal lipase-like domain-containing protein n=1 Tax=Phlyctema vagabunda TaxID=108571 RepID=A0ABR4PK32_9HELO